MRLKTLTSAVALSTALLSGAALADGHAKNAPVVFGEIDAGVQKTGSGDIDAEAFDASIGVKGTMVNGSFVAAYQIDAEFAAAANDANGDADIHIQNALIYLPTSLGGFLIAPRVESGQQNDIYKPVDVFQQNTADAGALWEQPDEATSVLAYVSPTFANTKVVAAALTLTGFSDNDDDADVLALRIVHSSGPLYLAGGIVQVSDETSEFLSGDKDWTRTALSAGYTFGPVSLGVLFEENDYGNDNRDSEVFGAVVDAKLGGGWSAAIGYTERDAETDSGFGGATATFTPPGGGVIPSAGDDEAVIAIVRKQLADSVFAYLEGADFENAEDNISAGINIRF